MFLAVAGDAHGQLTPLYDKVSALEAKHQIDIDWVLQTGNLGVWPDPQRIDRSTRKKGGDVDFFKYYLNYDPVPYQTIFVQGKHDDHRWLNFMNSRGQLEVMPNLNWLLNGYKTHIGNGEELSLVGLGKVYSPVAYTGEKKKPGAYTRAEIERACSHGPVDLLITHEAGKGAQIGNHVSVAEGINNICYAIRPKLHLHGHYNTSKTYNNPATSTPTISLAFGAVQALHYDGDKFTLLP